MLTALKFAISVLALAGASLAQDGLTIDNKHKERVSSPEVEKIYSSAKRAVTLADSTVEIERLAK